MKVTVEEFLEQYPQYQDNTVALQMFEQFQRTSMDYVTTVDMGKGEVSVADVIKECTHDRNIIKWIKLLRTLTGLGLKDAKDFVEGITMLTPIKNKDEKDRVIDILVHENQVLKNKLQAVKRYMEYTLEAIE